MQYRKDRRGEEISVLGFGCMRFTRKGAGIDYEKAEKEILRAVERGVNYFDTAYLYPGSEELLGKVVSSNGLRDRIRIATKLPQYLVKKEEAAERYFQEELRRLRTDFVDYYLMHMLTDTAAWERLKGLGIIPWIEEKKASGQVRQIGFSFHGTTDDFIRILEDYDWDFCQIQYNYMDETSQAGRRGLEAAAVKGIPVIIMEPLRGGKLTDLLPESAKKAIREANASGAKNGAGEPFVPYTAASLAFRWLWDQPAVTCVLSGMNSVAMVEENCATADRSLPGCLTEEERALIGTLRDSIGARLKVPCTGCAYCMPCPQGVDIPGAFRCYNEMYMENRLAGRKEYAQVIGLRKKKAFPTQCVGCGRCEKHCPQGISIIEELKKANRALRPWPYRVGTAAVRLFMTR